MLGTSAAKTTLLGGAVSALVLHYSQQGFVAPVWGEVSFAIWCAVLVLPATLPVAWERRQIAWGLLSVFVFEYFVLFVDPGFKVRNQLPAPPISSLMITSDRVDDRCEDGEVNATCTKASTA